MSPPRVLFISSHSRGGGSEVYLLRLLQELDHTWVAGVVCLEHGPLLARLRTVGYLPELVETGTHWAQIVRAAFSLRRLIRRARPDVIHANGVKAALVAVLATTLSPVPVVWLKHDFSWDGWLASLIGRRCREIVGVSTAVTETFSAHLRNRVNVVPLAIPERRIDRLSARRLVEQAISPVGQASEIILLVGRVDPLKGQRDAVGIAPAVLRHRPNAVFVFVGSHSDDYPLFREELEELVGHLGLTNSVRMLGYRRDAVELMAGSDIVLIPSRVEGASLVAIEAMAVGSPVVGYAVGGLPEVIGDCGILVHPGDRDALADGVVQALGDDALRARLGACGRQRASSVFSIERLVEAMKRRYREAAARST